MQSHALDPSDLSLLLALVRGGTLARAATALGVDASTVFRKAQRIEKRLGQRLFERSRTGYRPTELAQGLAGHAERIEAELEAARAATQARDAQVSGLLRLSTTDTLLQGLVLPALQRLAHAHPRLQFELHAGNEPVNLTRREADIALRATRRPPPHVIGRELGTLRSAVYGARPPGLAPGRRPPAAPDLADCAWVAVDEALPEHLSVLWRRRHLPRVQPQWRVNSILSVFDAVRLGLGVGIVPLFLARSCEHIVPLTPPLPECDTPLWLLTHPESRHLRRIATVASHLAEAIELPAKVASFEIDKAHA
jgi:DNA-binding transcriptional LysR family regulator